MSDHLEPTTVPGWDEYFLGIAAAVSARAKCTRRRVGAVLTIDHRIIATGYNGAAPGEEDCLQGACPRGLLGSDLVGFQQRLGAQNFARLAHHILGCPVSAGGVIPAVSETVPLSGVVWASAGVPAATRLARKRVRNIAQLLSI